MTTIPDIKSTYKTWFTWASLTPAQQAFATSQGYSSGSVSVAIGDVVDYVTQTVASTQTLLVDANGDPVCNYGFNGVANIPTDCTLEVTGGVLGINDIPDGISAVGAASVSINKLVVLGVSTLSAISTATITNTSTCRSVEYDIWARMVTTLSANLGQGVFVRHRLNADLGGGTLTSYFNLADEVTTPSTASTDFGNDKNIMTRIGSVTIPAGGSLNMRVQAEIFENGRTSASSNVVASCSAALFIIPRRYL